MSLKWRLCCLALSGSLLLAAGATAVYAQSTVNVNMAEFAFQPSTITVAPGSVTFAMHNTGQFPHTLHIDGVDDDLAPALDAGQSATATVNLAPGTYTFWCPVDGHRARGMEGTLVVASAQAARAGGLDPTQLAGLLAVGGVAALLVGLRRKRTAT